MIWWKVVLILEAVEMDNHQPVFMLVSRRTPAIGQPHYVLFKAFQANIMRAATVTTVVKGNDSDSDESHSALCGQPDITYLSSVRFLGRKRPGLQCLLTENPLCRAIAFFSPCNTNDASTMPHHHVCFTELAAGNPLLP